MILILLKIVIINIKYMNRLQQEKAIFENQIIEHFPSRILPSPQETDVSKVSQKNYLQQSLKGKEAKCKD